jgi:hypothetical protein
LYFVGGDDVSIRELEVLRESVKVMKATDEERSKETSNLEKRLREALYEHKSIKANIDDDSSRYITTISELTQQKKSLEQKCSELQQQRNSSMLLDEARDEDRSKPSALETQVTHLGQQLLRKETVVLELQAERAALKSKIQDLTLRYICLCTRALNVLNSPNGLYYMCCRCSSAEKKLMRLKDVEEDDDDGNDDEPPSSSYAYNSYSQVTNRGQRRNGGPSDSHQVEEQSRSVKKGRGKLITDDIYDKIGVRTNPIVATAVNALDSWILVTGR